MLEWMTIRSRPRYGLLYSEAIELLNSGFDQPVVLGMCPESCPHHVLAVFHGQRSVVQPDPRRPELAHFHKVERWVARVR